MISQLRNAWLAISVGGLALAALLGLIGRSAAQAAPQRSDHTVIQTQDQSANLLINPDFEEGYSRSLPCCDNIAVPTGWNIHWYTDTFEGDPAFPFKQPEVKIDDNTQWPFCDGCAPNVPPRIHTGRYAVDSFVLFANQDTSLYQQVGNIPIGAVVTGSAWLHAWVSSCNPFPTAPGASPQPALSLLGPNDDQGNCSDAQFWPTDSNLMLVGIDPTGGVDPRAVSVVWNWDKNDPQWWGPYDYYSPTLPVVAVAQAHTVTLFLRAVTKTPAKYDDVYFDTASLVYSFPISASIDQGQLWPLPVTVTFSLQSPVSLTQVLITATDPEGAAVPIGLASTTGVSLAITSIWTFNPTMPGRHVVTLQAHELVDPVIRSIDVQALAHDYVQDRLLPGSGVTPTEQVLITFTLYSPISLTNVMAVLTDPLDAQLPITLASAEWLTPNYDYRWQFAPLTAGLHSLRLDAGEFTQPWVLSVMAASNRIFLPVILED